MKRKELKQGRNKRGLLLWTIVAACFTLTGCASFGPFVLNKAVILYDEDVLKSEEQLLLLNIIRMHYGQPPHFTVASAVQATFTLSSVGGINPSVSNGQAKNTLGLSLNTTISDSPTITIVPMQGKDMSDRLLKPIDPKFINKIILQQGGERIDKMLRLICRDLTIYGYRRSKDIFERTKVLPYANWNKFTYPTPDDFIDKAGEDASCLLKDYGFCYATNKPFKKTSLGKDAGDYQFRFKMPKPTV